VQAWVLKMQFAQARIPLDVGETTVLHEAPFRSWPSQSSSPSATLLPHVVAGDDGSSEPQLAMAAVMQSERKVPNLKRLLIVA
jgi:hypothetical protein